LKNGIPFAGDDEIVSVEELAALTLGKSRMSLTVKPDGFDPPTPVFKSVILMAHSFPLNFVWKIKPHNLTIA
jgi:hypothetical protein